MRSPFRATCKKVAVGGTGFTASSMGAQSSEKQTNILHQKFRLLERREMAAARYFRPVLHVESAFDPAPGRHRAFSFQKTRNSAWDGDVISPLEVKRSAVVFGIQPAGGM